MKDMYLAEKLWLGAMIIFMIFILAVGIHDGVFFN